MYGDGSDVGLLGTDCQIISKFEQVSLVIKKIQTLSIFIFNVLTNSTAMSMEWNVVFLNNDLNLTRNIFKKDIRLSDKRHI